MTDDAELSHGNALVIAVPTSQTDVQVPYRKVGAGALDTPRCTSTPGCRRMR
jgi:acyl-ACP dehydrogenase